MLSSGADNQKYLKQLSKGGIQKHFANQYEDKNTQFIQSMNPISNTKANQNLDKPSPRRQKIHQDFKQIDVQLKSVKNKTFNNSRWDAFAPYSFNKLNSAQKDNVFQKLFQEFQQMKVQHNQYVQKYIRLSAKLHKISEDLGKFKRKSDLSPPQKMRINKQSNEQSIKMKEQIKRLHQKISALTNPKNVGINTRPKSSIQNKTQKTIFPVNQNIKAQLQLQKKHVKQLLQVIDDLRLNKLIIERQLKQKSINKHIQNIPSNDIRNKRPVQSNNQQKFKQYSDQLYIWKQKYQQMQLCYNKMNQSKDNTIRQLNTQLIQLKQAQRMKKKLQTNNTKNSFLHFGHDQRLKQLQDINQKLQRELKDLVRNPLFKDNNQSLDFKKKNQQLESLLQKSKQQLLNLKQSNAKYLSQLEYKTKQSAMLKNQSEKLKKQLKQQMQKDIKSTNNASYKYDEDDYYRKLLHLVKLQGNDPVWKKYCDLTVPVFTVMTQLQLREMCQRLWQNKLQLLAHLQKAQIQLKTNKQSNDSRLNAYLRQKQNLQQEVRLSRAKLDQWMSMDRTYGRRDFQVYQVNGIKYNDTVQQFQDDEQEINNLDHNQNFFDLFLGQINLDQQNVLRFPQNKIKTMNSIITFLTVDFYTHPTQHSNFAQGITKKLLNNFSFKVEVNPGFMKFLTKNAISIELWSPQGTSTILFGKGQIWLKDLMNNTAKDVSNVISGKCPIYSSSKALIGTVEYRIRMRLPLGPFLEWSNPKQKSSLSKNDAFSISQHKKLSITIQRAQNLSKVGHTFVYFSIQTQDFFTQPQIGSNPFWDYHKQIDVVLDQDFMAYVKENFVQFTLFDDDKEVNQDVVGVAKANLTPLLDNKYLDLVLDIQNTHFQTVGHLKVKINWL